MYENDIINHANSILSSSSSISISNNSEISTIISKTAATSTNLTASSKTNIKKKRTTLEIFLEPIGSLMRYFSFQESQNSFLVV